MEEVEEEEEEEEEEGGRRREVEEEGAERRVDGGTSPPESCVCVCDREKEREKDTRKQTERQINRQRERDRWMERDRERLKGNSPNSFPIQARSTGTPKTQHVLLTCSKSHTAHLGTETTMDIRHVGGGPLLPRRTFPAPPRFL